MTDSTTSIQAWDTIETIETVTSEQHLSVVESFSSHYHKFLGYQPGDEEIWWSGLAGSQFAEDTSNRPFWNHPLAKTGVLGASGLAATLLVGVALSETTAHRQPTFTFQEPAQPSQLDLSQESSTGNPAPVAAIAPTSPSIEFSGSKPSSTTSSSPEAQNTSLPEVSIPQLVQSPGRWNLPHRSPLSEDTGLTARISHPTTTDNRPVTPPSETTRPQPQPSRLSPNLAETSTDRAQLAPTATAGTTRSPMLDVLGRLPTLEQAAPQEMDSGNAESPTSTTHQPDAAVRTPDAEPQTAQSTPSAQPDRLSVYPGSAEALPLPQASPLPAQPSLPAQPPLPSTPATGNSTDTHQSKLSFERVPSLPIAEAPSPSAHTPIAEQPTFSASDHAKFEQPNGTERLLSDRTLSFSRQNAASSDVLAYYPVFGATVQSAAQMVTIASTQHANAGQATPAIAPAQPTHQGAGLNANKVDQSLNSIHDFVNYKRLSSGHDVRVLPLTRQAATEARNTPMMEQFRVLQLSPSGYQTSWTIRNSSFGTLPPAPAYGFIDYQRQLIIVPNAS